jgi:hypothetical protein
MLNQNIPVELALKIQFDKHKFDRIVVARIETTKWIGRISCVEEEMVDTEYNGREDFYTLEEKYLRCKMCGSLSKVGII